MVLRGGWLLRGLGRSSCSARTMPRVLRVFVLVASAVVGAGVLAGCGGGGDVADEKSTTAVSSTTAAAFDCPLTLAQVTPALQSGKPVALIAKTSMSCEFGTSLGEATSDPAQPVASVGLQAVSASALQAGAKSEHPNARLRTRSDLGRQSFELDESMPQGVRRVTLIGAALQKNTSWVIAVDMPTSATATAKARKRAEALYALL